MRRWFPLIAAALASSLLPSQANAQSGGLAVRDSFRIGSRGVLCTAQLQPPGDDIHGLFDRSYAISCRDAAAKVGRLLALRDAGANALGALLDRRSKALDCAPFAAAKVEALPGASLAECQRREDGLPYRIYALPRGRTLYVAEGYRGYDSAVVLGFRTLIANRPVEGTVDVAILEAGDPAAFARTQAGSLDAQAAMNEGYARNNAGNFAEAAAFFGALIDGNGGARSVNSAEYFLNAGLQQANLGNTPAAEVSFQQAEDRGAGSDPVLGRMLRNYRAMTLLSKRDNAGALTVLDTPVVPVAAESEADLSQGLIAEAMADRLNRDNAGSRRVGIVDGRLRPYERAQILDGQREMLRGIALRMQGKSRDALAAFAQASVLLAGVRNGKVESATFLLAEILAETADVEDAQGNVSAAERDLTQSLHLLDVTYPQSSAGLTAKARLAAFHARRGDTDTALRLYGEIVAANNDTPGGIAPLRDLLKPYFALLAKRADSDSSAVAQMFAANQVLVRPGLAQTQAVFARELSAGDDEAARLFRDALNRSREISRTSGDIAALAEGDPRTGTPDAVSLATARDRLKSLEEEQTTIQAKLAEYPRYRVFDPQGLSLTNLQKALRLGEAYYEMRVIGQDAYAVLITADGAHAARIEESTDQLAAQVTALRASIVKVEDGKFVTSPFDLVGARKLYLALFGPFGDVMNGIHSLIYEPDGPLLELPANLLVTDQASVDRYAARSAKPNANPFDFTGVAWLGRGRDVTTAVSPRSFVDIRSAPPSTAKLAYLGLGHNARPDLMASFLSPKPIMALSDPCAWPASAWSNPISAAELYSARDRIGAARSLVITGKDFSDTAIMARPDLASYRIVHFATHGLVTAPRAGCPAQPALLTSFGASGSDGLLSFREIYDMRIDADLVILSACDTAGMATISATREAGVETGGNFALDGLVRAFVGAGARTVVASHWPVPDDYNATQRLVLGMVSAPRNTSVAGALRGAETALMDDPATSHPYYWAAFAVVGDGERAIAR